MLRLLVWLWTSWFPYICQQLPKLLPFAVTPDRLQYTLGLKHRLEWRHSVHLRMLYITVFSLFSLRCRRTLKKLVFLTMLSCGSIPLFVDDTLSLISGLCVWVARHVIINNHSTLVYVALLDLSGKPEWDTAMLRYRVCCFLHNLLR